MFGLIKVKVYWDTSFNPIESSSFSAASNVEEEKTSSPSLIQQEETKAPELWRGNSGEGMTMSFVTEHGSSCFHQRARDLEAREGIKESSTELHQITHDSSADHHAQLEIRRHAETISESMVEDDLISWSSFQQALGSSHHEEEELDEVHD